MTAFRFRIGVIFVLARLYSFVVNDGCTLVHGARISTTLSKSCGSLSNSGDDERTILNLLLSKY